MATHEEEFVGQALLDVLEEASSPLLKTSNDLTKESETQSEVLTTRKQRNRNNKRLRKLLEQNNNGENPAPASTQTDAVTVQHGQSQPPLKKLSKSERKRLRAATAQATAQSATGNAETEVQTNVTFTPNKAYAQAKPTKKERLKKFKAAQASQEQPQIPEAPKNWQPYQRNFLAKGTAGIQDNDSLAISAGQNGISQGSKEHGTQHILPPQQVVFNGNKSYVYLPPNKKFSQSEVMQINQHNNNYSAQHDQEMLGQEVINNDWPNDFQSPNPATWPLSLPKYNSNQMFPRPGADSVKGSFPSRFNDQSALGRSQMFSPAMFPMSFMPIFPSVQWPQQVQDFHTSSHDQSQVYLPYDSSLYQRQHPEVATSPEETGPRRSSRIAKNEIAVQLPNPPANEPPPKSEPNPHISHMKAAPSVPGPTPTTAYITQAHAAPVRLTSPQPLLIISDLNGTLIYRKVSHTSYHARPQLAPFLAHVFATHSIMIWTSARPHNATAILNKALTATQRSQLIASWARDTLSLTRAQYEGKVQVYKRLQRVWSDPALQKTCPASGGRWSQANTLLMDDSLEKARAQPYNLVNVPELSLKGVAAERAEEFPVLVQVQGYLEEARWWSDVSVFARARPFKVGQGWERGGTETSPAVVGELRLESGVFVDATPQPDPADSGTDMQRAIELRKAMKEKKKLGLKTVPSQPTQQVGEEDVQGEGGFQVRRMWTRDFQKVPGSIRR